MPISPDRSVVPSYLSPYGGVSLFDNVSLKLGEVKEILYPNNRRNLSQRFTEYVVQTQEATGVSSLVNCVVASTFGGVGDYLNYTVHPDNGNGSIPAAEARTDLADSSLGNGNQVLILCVNGSRAMPLIIGGWPMNSDDCVDTLGHNLHFNFNGVDATINKDGEFTLTYEGATDNLGDPASGVDAKSVGSKITFTKDGSIYLGDGTGKQSIKIDHQKQQIIVLDEKGVLVGAATDAWVLGTTYRKAEHSSNQSVMQQLNLAMQQLTLASSMLTTAGGLLGIPVVGAMMASQPVTAAAQAVSAAGQALKAAASAIQSFEGKADSYLSKKNLTD